jgi:predicted PurR-regulated permease PerM
MGRPSSDSWEHTGFADRHPTRAALVRRILRWGKISWALVGIALFLFIGYSTAAALSGLVVPSLFAIFAGACLVPVLDLLALRGLNRRLGALLLIIALGAVVLAGGVVLVRGLIVEGDAIRTTLVGGVDAIQVWLDEGDVAAAGGLVDAVIGSASPLLTGAASWATAFVSTTLTLAIGAFLAIFLLYYVLVDWTQLRQWLAGHLGVPTELGSQIIEDATDVVRRGIGVLTILGALDAGLVALTMMLLDLPFPLGVAVVFFLGCYVPYLGTFIAGVFAVLIALGGGGPVDAAIVLVVILVVDIVVRTLVGNWLATDRLALRPLPSIVSSAVGVAVAGLLGAVLSAPALALGIAVSRRVRAARTSIVEPTRGDA